MLAERELHFAWIQRLVMASWSGRDATLVAAHIKELEALGVKPPKSTPFFYHLAASLLTTSVKIQVLGEDTSGEVETVIVSLQDGLWIGLGSDHTDRKVQPVNVAVSKQLCAKPCCPRMWQFDDVAAHWDKLVLRSWATTGDRRRLYQEGTLASVLHPSELVRRYTGGQKLPPATAMFCGTVPVQGNIAPAEIFEIELDDPVLGRKLQHQYRVEPLPVNA
jgi:hypothetical protein